MPTPTTSLRQRRAGEAAEGEEGGSHAWRRLVFCLARGGRVGPAGRRRERVGGYY